MVAVFPQLPGGRALDLGKHAAPRAQGHWSKPPAGDLSVLISAGAEDAALHLVDEIRDHGYTVSWRRVSTAEEMDLALSFCPWDVVLSQYGLVGFSGLDALALIRKRRLDLPLILIAEEAAALETAIAAVKAGARDYIAMYDLTRLAPAVEREVREAAGRRARHRPHRPAGGRSAWLTELRDAIQRDQLVLHYQPEIDVATGELTCVEALVRWQHPRYGLIPPDEFIAHAEHSGLIQALGRWVIEAALQQYQEWRIAGHDVPIAVNVSMRELQDHRLPGTIARLLERWDVPPDRITLEVTESGIMSNPGRAIEVLTRLRALGVATAIDDFGAGYSSLRYIKQLPVGELKIDRTFVQAMATDRSDAAIVRAAIDLARGLDLDVVAEGVEDEPTWQILRSLHCDTAQGFYLSRPLPAEAVLPWAAARVARSQFPELGDGRISA